MSHKNKKRSAHKYKAFSPDFPMRPYFFTLSLSIILFLLCVSVGSLIIKYYADSIKSFKTDHSALLFEPKNALEKEAQESLFTYFQTFKNPTQSEYDRLEDFIIGPITDVHLKNNELRFHATFSLKTSEKAYRWTPMGKWSGDKWITNIKTKVIAEKAGNHFKVIGMPSGMTNADW